MPKLVQTITKRLTFLENRLNASSDEIMAKIITKFKASEKENEQISRLLQNDRTLPADLNTLGTYYLLIAKILIKLSMTLPYEERIEKQTAAKDLCQQVEDALEKTPISAIHEIADLLLQIKYEGAKICFELAVSVLTNPDSELRDKAQEPIANFKCLLEKSYKDPAIRKQLEITPEFMERVNNVAPTSPKKRSLEPSQDEPPAKKCLTKLSKFSPPSPSEEQRKGSSYVY